MGREAGTRIVRGDMTYDDFFQHATGFAPLPYQRALADGEWPEVLDVPTGLGKTAAVVVAWLYRRLTRPAETPRRLVFCLPMRVLVRQTVEVIAGGDPLGDGRAAVAPEPEGWLGHLASLFEEAGQPRPTVHALMGGEVDARWERQPEHPAILVGTQDLLISRALNRGYAMSRFRWPVHFGLLSSDCLWVLDETQLMGVAVETSAQLAAFRRMLGTHGPTHTLWMSATVGRGQLDTVDHPAPAEGFRQLSLGAEDAEHPLVQQRLGARKALASLEGFRVEKEDDAKHARALAERVLELHRAGSRTLVIVNRVARAQSLYRALLAAGRTERDTFLIHSRFRPYDRQLGEAELRAEGDRIAVATQAIEAGIDISSRTMVTELAPWPSLVQRFGRCNRYGEHDDAAVYWIDIDESGSKGRCSLPYQAGELARGRALLSALDDVGPGRLREVGYEPPAIVRPVIRRKDLLDLFDTTPDLSGSDVDVSRFVRDSEDIDVRLYWRAFEGSPDQRQASPSRDELCAVTIGAARDLVAALAKRGRNDKRRLAWRWDALEGKWNPLSDARRIQPGDRLLLHADAGGYSPLLGFSAASAERVEPVAVGDESAGARAYDGDPATSIGTWIPLEQHLAHVHREAETLVASLGLPAEDERALLRAAAWHDIGKAHETFQSMLLEPGKTEPVYAPPREGALWAKSNHDKGRPDRPHFRHELGSALRFLADCGDEADADRVAFLIACHHGKVRLSIRSLPGEPGKSEPKTPGTLFARGWHQGDPLPWMGQITLLDGTRLDPAPIDLSPMLLGEGSWLERMLSLRDRVGPFRLAYLEAVMRTADGRASAREKEDGYDD